MTYKKVSFLILILFFATAPSSKAQEFEGVIYYEIPAMVQQGVEELPYMVKDSKVRMGFGGPAGKAAMLFMPEQSKAVIIIDKMKGYMVMNLDEFANQSQDQPEMKVTNTGKTKTIAGKSCEVWVMKSDNGHFETCISKELGTFMMPKSSTFRENSPAWAKELSEGGFMPLEVYQIDENGEKMLKLRALRIEEKTLPASLFEIPEGYRDMSNIMQGMMNQFQN